MSFSPIHACIYTDACEQVKKEAAAELMRLLRIITAMHKFQKELAGTPQQCGVGLVLKGHCEGHREETTEENREHPSSPCSPTHALYAQQSLAQSQMSQERTLERSTQPDKSVSLSPQSVKSLKKSPKLCGGVGYDSVRDGARDRDVPCEKFVVCDLIEGFSAAMSCALQKGDRVLCVDGVEVCGKTESVVGKTFPSFLHFVWAILPRTCTCILPLSRLLSPALAVPPPVLRSLSLYSALASVCLLSK